MIQSPETQSLRSGATYTAFESGHEGTPLRTVVEQEVPTRPTLEGHASRRPRITPRVSLVVVLTEQHAVSPEQLARRLPLGTEDDTDVIVVCAGRPQNWVALQRCLRGARFFFTPPGTSPEDLRELAMAQAPGDIVTLMNGAKWRLAPVARRDVPGTA